MKRCKNSLKTLQYENETDIRKKKILVENISRTESQIRRLSWWEEKFYVFQGRNKNILNLTLFKE